MAGPSPHTDASRRSVELRDAGVAHVVVTLVDTHGSSPADAGARMVVAATESANHAPNAAKNGATNAAVLDCGTVGGGRVEAQAIGVAAEMLADPTGPATRFVDWSLKADVGMTCGGRVRLYFERHASGRLADAAWPIVVYGAGHVAQALARLLATLPCHATFVDPRGEWLSKLPAGVTTCQTDDPPEHADGLPDGAFALCMTRGHATDLPVLVRLLSRERPLPYIGVIGSAAKRAVLCKELTEAEVPADRQEFHCPIGLPIGTNHPAEIAVSIAAQLLQERTTDA